MKENVIFLYYAFVSNKMKVNSLLFVLETNPKTRGLMIRFLCEYEETSKFEKYICKYISFINILVDHAAVT